MKSARLDFKSPSLIASPVFQSVFCTLCSIMNMYTVTAGMFTVLLTQAYKWKRSGTCFDIRSSEMEMWGLRENLCHEFWIKVTPFEKKNIKHFVVSTRRKTGETFSISHACVRQCFLFSSLKPRLYTAEWHDSSKTLHICLSMYQQLMLQPGAEVTV